ncbi:hypothetical protein O6H91_05G097000 [Diphasiastrum complanatum]|uniref:Uncharacterized protein n=1 Tax=Diphasiastrum complanatum TaxID=34168 RepID=A0ACC2DR16_DIPCM|nr:hypothetical protein O6H91_05G097000 [Diphasiastrum complanatum]
MEGSSGKAPLVDAAFQLLLACPAGLSRSQVSVDFKNSYDREPHPDKKLEESIEHIWNCRLAVSPSLFNGSKFRYGGFHMIDGEGDLEKPQNLCIHLGLTDYKTFVGTNLSHEWEHFLVPVEEDVTRCRHTASPLGNGAIVETADSQILLLQRSVDVGEFPGHVVFPGGHSEPDEVGIKSDASGSLSRMNNELNGKIAAEMFDGIIREVVEETGVPATYLSEPIFLGISRRVINVRPTAFFYVRCYLSSEAVFDHYNHAEHAFESTKLSAVSRDDLPHEAKKMPGCHQGGAALYTLMFTSAK